MDRGDILYEFSQAFNLSGKEITERISYLYAEKENLTYGIEGFKENTKKIDTGE